MNTAAPLPAASVRVFQAEDIPAVQSLVNASPGAAQWSTNSYEQLVHGPYFALVISERDAILGFIALRVVHEEAEILNLAIAPAYRRVGYASRLLQAAEAAAKERGAVAAYLEVRESNAAAIRFYEKSGFAQTAKRPGYYRDPEEAAILMMKKLTGFPD